MVTASAGVERYEHARPGVPRIASHTRFRVPTAVVGRRAWRSLTLTLAAVFLHLIVHVGRVEVVFVATVRLLDAIIAVTAICVLLGCSALLTQHTTYQHKSIENYPHGGSCQCWYAR